MSCERCGGFKVFDYFDGPFHCSGYRCINCGAITEEEALATGLTLDELRSRSFVKIMKGRRASAA